MSTGLRPEPSSGEYRIPQARPTPAAEPHVAAGRRRLDHVDLLRGLVMVIMVLDHVRDYFTAVRFDPTDLTRTHLALFATLPAAAHGSPGPAAPAASSPASSSAAGYG